MEVRFHKRVQADLDEVLSKYYKVSRQLGDDFFVEFQLGVKKAVENPSFFHFDRTGLRRCNLHRFPYHFLYESGWITSEFGFYGTTGEIQILV